MSSSEHALKQQIGVLAAALRPFAEAADTFDYQADETLMVHPHISLSDYRRAREVLADLRRARRVEASS